MDKIIQITISDFYNSEEETKYRAKTTIWGKTIRASVKRLFSIADAGIDLLLAAEILVTNLNLHANDLKQKIFHTYIENKYLYYPEYYKLQKQSEIENNFLNEIEPQKIVFHADGNADLYCVNVLEKITLKVNIRNKIENIIEILMGDDPEKFKILGRNDIIINYCKIIEE